MVEDSIDRQRHRLPVQDHRAQPTPAAVEELHQAASVGDDEAAGTFVHGQLHSPAPYAPRAQERAAVQVQHADAAGRVLARLFRVACGADASVECVDPAVRLVHGQG
jgi:hypothetical protein